jgi:hypothetical protein
MDDLAWMLGKIIKYKPRAKKYNFDVEWATGIITEQQAGRSRPSMFETNFPCPATLISNLVQITNAPGRNLLKLF